jgi:hypothetical protein
VFDKVLDALAGGAEWSVEFDRDADDNYFIRVARTGGHGGDLHDEDVLPLIPKGSQWSPAQGWRSFFGRFLKISGQCWLALGGQSVVAHAFRGAFPRMRVHLFRFEKPRTGTVYDINREREYLDALVKAVAVIDAGETPPWCKPYEPGVTTTVIESRATQPQQHTPYEAHILREAKRAYQQDDPLQFRTLILCDAEIQEIRVGSDCKQGPAPFIVASAEPIRRSLSKQNQRWLGARFESGGWNETP